MHSFRISLSSTTNMACEPASAIEFSLVCLCSANAFGGRLNSDNRNLRSSGSTASHGATGLSVVYATEQPWVGIAIWGVCV
jgi:hypothetical protein